MTISPDAYVAITIEAGVSWDSCGLMYVGGYSDNSLPQVSESSKSDMQKAATSGML